MERKNKPTYNFYTRCIACNAPLNRRSRGVSKGINESPYCKICEKLYSDVHDEYSFTDDEDFD